MTKALLYTLERPAPHTLTAAAGSPTGSHSARAVPCACDSFARPGAVNLTVEDVLGAAARGGGSCEAVISTFVPCSSLVMRRRGVNSNLRR